MTQRRTRPVGVTPLRAHRLERGMSVAGAAERLRIKPATLYYLERTGGIPRDADVVRRILDLYDTSFSVLWSVRDAA